MKVDYQGTSGRSQRSGFRGEGGAFSGSLSFAAFSRPTGPDLLGRLNGFWDFYTSRTSTGSWFYTRFLEGPPESQIEGRDESGRAMAGLNFGSQDYLSLTSHPVVREAAVAAIHDFGPHSAGSACAMGNTTLSAALERELGEFLAAPHVLLFPTGWAAGYGSIVGLVRSDDHVVLDRYAHNCLQQGAAAATRNIHRAEHLDCDHVEMVLRSIRTKHAQAGILLVTESLFSMHSDTPDLVRLQALAKEFGATLLVDVAHDLGSGGSGGLGALEAQGLVGKVDLVMGSFSKSFASNGGFLASSSASAKQFVKLFGSSHMFSNALSPMQAAVVRAALGIIRGEEGADRRRRLATAIGALRSELTSLERPALGIPSPIVPVPVGDEVLARSVNARLSDYGVIAQLVEYPIVPHGQSRARMQVMADHSESQAREAARLIDRAVRTAESELLEKLAWESGRAL